MPKPLARVISDIGQGKTPRVLLVGGSSDFLSEQAFHELRDAIVAQHPSISVETYEPGSELAAILDSYRTGSLFGGSRLLIVPEVNAFVSAKEIASLFEKALSDWKSAKTDRKRASSAAKLLHVLGLVNADLEMTDRNIADALSVPLEATLTDILAFCRTTGKKAGREGFVSALDQAIAAIAADANVKFDANAVSRLRQRLGIERMLADKFSKDIPELRGVVSEAERLATLVGSGGRVTAAIVDREIAAIEGGARYELGSLFTEGKILEAVTKLRDLVAQARREDPKSSAEIHYGRYLFAIPDELRQMIGIHSWARAHNVNLRTSVNYNRFKDTIADKLGDYLKAHGLVRQRPHPFPLHKKFEAARGYSEAELFRALSEMADLDIKRKSGGLPIDVGMETFLLSRLRG